MPNEKLRYWILYHIDKGELRSWVVNEMREAGKNPDKQYTTEKQPLYTRQEINAEIDAMLKEGELVKGERLNRNQYFIHNNFKSSRSSSLI
jgi:hypothetical protein